MAKGYRTGSVSKMVGMSREALRYYEKKRVLTPETTDAQNGYRYYQRADMAHLFKIKYNQALGFPLSDIRCLFWDFTLAQWQQAVSYTHLDVYKRQANGRRYHRFVAACPSGRRRWTWRAEIRAA